jgi:DNA-binding SARP family transcriptional activator
MNQKKHPSLQVRLLGPPEVAWLGQSIHIPRRQTRALLYFLAARPQLIPRERLCLLFWADSPTSLARRNLTHLLNNLRHSLPDPTLLLSGEDRVGLDPQRVESDLLEFEHLCAAARSSPPSLAQLEQAASLYRKPFLDGSLLPNAAEFEEWVVLQQQSCERAYLEVLAELVEEYARRADLPAAIACARRYLETDELGEEMHRRLIELYALNGDRLAALRQYERCIAVLERELGVDPLPETSAVYRAVLDGRTPGPSAELQPSWSTLPGLNTPFVGRQDAHRTLEQAFTRARRGRGGVIWITGEPGIGKTRLLQEFTALHRGEARLLVGSACADMQLHPYHPVVQALRPILQEPSFRTRLSPAWLAEVSRLLPELDNPQPSPASLSHMDAAQARARLFEALRQVVLSLAVGPWPVVFCLDDMQWCDHTSLDWLAYLAQSLAGSPVLVLATCCSAEAEALEPLRRRLWRLGCLTELHLDGLEVSEIIQLLHHLVGPAQGVARLAERLQQATGGNPFFLAEILRLSLESGQLLESPPDLEDFPLPDTVRQAVESHLERLSPVAMQVLQAASALLPPIDGASLVLTTGRAELEVADALDELVARQFLVAEAQAEGGGFGRQAHYQVSPENSYRFLHRIVRAVVYQAMSPWRRGLLHQRAAQALQRLRPDEPAALVWHYQRADQPGLAAQFSLQAGQSAQRVFAFTEALTHFDAALAMLERELPRLHQPASIDENRRQRIHALEGRCWVYRLQGEMCRYEDDLQAAIQEAQLLGDQEALASLRWREAANHRWFCRFDQARQAAQDGVERCRLAGYSHAEALCWRELGMARRALGDFQQAETALERALQGFVRLGDSVYLVHTLGNLSTLSLMKGDAQGALTLAQQALVHCDQHALHFERRVALGDLGAAALVLGDFEQAQRWLEESLQLARLSGDRSQEIFALGKLGELLLQRGDLIHAQEWFSQALALAEQIGAQLERPWLGDRLAVAQRLAAQRRHPITRPLPKSSLPQIAS